MASNPKLQRPVPRAGTCDGCHSTSSGILLPHCGLKAFKFLEEYRTARVETVVMKAHREALLARVLDRPGGGPVTVSRSAQLPRRGSLTL